MNVKKRVSEWMSRHPQVKWIVSKAREVSFPGFEGVPVYYVLQFFFKEIKDDRINMRASSVAFYLLLALFPGIIFLFTLIPYIPINNFQEILFNNLQQVMPATAFDFMQSAITDIISTERVELLSVGFILAFLFSTNGVHALAKSFDKSHDLFRKRSFIAQRLTDIKLTAVLFLILVLAVGLVVLGNQLINYILNTMNVISAWQIFLLNVFRWVIILLVFFLGISFIYYYAPATRKKFRFISIGSIVATSLTVLASLAFSFVVNNYNLYNEIYGSIGALIAIMFWLYLNCFGLLVGFELNTSVKYMKMAQREDEKEEAAMEE